MRKLIYIGIFLACVLPIAWPTNWWITWPDGWWNYTWEKSAEIFLEKKAPRSEFKVPGLKIGKNVLHINNSGKMTFGKITKIRKESSGLFIVHLQNDSGKQKIPAHNGTWIDIDEVLKQEYYENKLHLNWE